MEQSQWAPKPQAEVSMSTWTTVSTDQGVSIDPLPPKQADDQQAASSLSAEAATFSPSPVPATLDSSATPDTFAQTGAGQDDVFDEVTPVDDSMRVRSEDDLFSDDFTPTEQTVIEQPTPAPAPSQRRGRSERARGRGARARGDGERGTHHGGAVSRRQDTTSKPNHQPQPDPPANAPTGPQKDTTPAVRNGRHSAGGTIKPKLTDAELAEKMAAIQIKNASLTAAHARAEADAASFVEREAKAKALAAQRQKRERQDRQQMMGERERNRLRKLKGIEGREWDKEKTEAEFARAGGKFDKNGNFAGDREDYSDGREYLYKEPREGGRRGRGGAAGGEKRGPVKEQSVPKGEDFPALPPKEPGGDGKKLDAAPRSETDGGRGGGSWADQVELSSSAAGGG